MNENLVFSETIWLKIKSAKAFGPTKYIVDI